MARETTERGFGIYAELTDTNGSQIRVQESSAADGPCVWIFADWDRSRWLSEHERTMLASAGFGDLAGLAAKLCPSPHLDVAQAKLVRTALGAFIDENCLHGTGDRP